MTAPRTPIPLDAQEPRMLPPAVALVVTLLVSNGSVWLGVETTAPVWRHAVVGWLAGLGGCCVNCGAYGRSIAPAPL